jgi:cytosine/adenosine deaminase-related metal-dependent hydrolase
MSPFARLFIALVTVPVAAVAQEPLVIRNVTVIAMTGAAPSTGQTVIVRDGRIAQLGPTAQIREPRAARVVDGAGKFRIPGLFDMHVHTSKTRASALGRPRRSRFTTRRNCRNAGPAGQRLGAIAHCFGE